MFSGYFTRKTDVQNLSLFYILLVIAKVLSSDFYCCAVVFGLVCCLSVPSPILIQPLVHSVYYVYNPIYRFVDKIQFLICILSTFLTVKVYFSTTCVKTGSTDVSNILFRRCWNILCLFDVKLSLPNDAHPNPVLLFCRLQQWHRLYII